MFRIQREQIKITIWQNISICIIALLVLSCNGVGPQRPTQRMGRDVEPDSATLALMEFNHRLALAADEQLLQIVQSLPENYALYEGGAWANVLEKGDTLTEGPQLGKDCGVRMRVFNLNEQLLIDTEGTWNIGHLELPYAVDRNIPEWNHHSRVKMYVPWYSAYGLKGTEDVPPYENVIIELEIQ